jgi:hypothetical protein
LLSACGDPPNVQVLNSRVAARMAPPQVCTSQATVEYLPNGARISLPDTVLFVVGRTDISPCGQYALASIVEAMLDPRLMQVIIEPGGDLDSPDAYLPRERTTSLKATLSNIGFVPDQPPVLVQPAPVSAGRAWGIVLTVPG